MGGSISNAALAGGDQPLAGKQMYFRTSYQVGIGGSTIYTVPAGKVFYLIQATLAFFTSDADAQVKLYVFSGDLQILRDWSSSTHLSNGISTNFSYPIPIPAAAAISIYTDTANTEVRGSIIGWLEDE